MGYRLGVDLGTTRTTATIDDGSGAILLDLAPGAPPVPSVAFLSPDGTLLFGEAADRLATDDPARGARAFKRRVGDPTPVVLGGRPFPPQELFVRFLTWTVGVATERQGAAPDELVLPYPASWSGPRRELLQHEVARAPLPPVRSCTAAEAAAAHLDTRAQLEQGARIAVYDLGGGSFDASVLEKRSAGFAVLAADGAERLGGIDLDEIVLGHVLGRLVAQAPGLDPGAPPVAALVPALRTACVAAKEALSRDAETSIPVTLPGLTTSVRLTREELDDLLAPPLRDTIEAMQRSLRTAGLRATDLATVLLVGGGSRIPLVSHLVQSEFGVRTTTSDDPQLDVALGALRQRPPAAQGQPATGPAPTASPWPTRGAAPADPASAASRPTPDAVPPGVPAPRPAAPAPAAAPAAPDPVRDHDTAPLAAVAGPVPPPPPPPEGQQESPPLSQLRAPVPDRTAVPPVSTVYAGGLPPPTGPSDSWTSEPAGRGGMSGPLGWGLAAVGAVVAVAVVVGVVYYLGHRGDDGDAGEAATVVGQDVIVVPIAGDDGDPVLHQLSTDPDRFGEDLGTVTGDSTGTQLLPSLSRDGALLGYLGAPPGSGFNRQIGTPMEVTADGDPVTLFTTPPKGLHCHGRPAWSPDGSQVAMLCFDDLDDDGTDDNTHPGVYLFPLDDDGRVGSVPSGLWAKSTQSDIGGVSFTTSGEVVAGYADGPEPGIYVGKLGKPPVPLTRGEDEDPVASPTDDLVAFVRDGDLYVAATDDAAPLPCPAPREVSTDETTRARLCNLTGTTTGPDAVVQSPTWSWDGKTIAYRIEDPADQTSTVWLVKLASGISVPLTTEPALMGAPAWGPR